MRLTADTLIKARWVIPVIPENTVLEHHAIAISNGMITAIVPGDTPCDAHEVIELDHHILMPGLINAHCHAAMSLLRGYANDIALKDWLDNHIWPAEGRWVSDEFVYDGSLLAIAEMIRSGTTCFSDMYFFPDATARAALHAGVRCQLSFPIFEFPSNWGNDANEYIHKGIQVSDLYRGNDHIHIAFGPHAPYTVADKTFEKIIMLAEEMNAAIQIHLHETRHEVDESVATYGIRPIKRLHQLGLLTPQTQCVHMTTLNDEDITILEMSGSHVIHCPESNLKLASGFCPVDKLLKRGINVALGTDGAASNDDMDLFSEMRTAALLAKAVADDPSAVNAHAALRMATIDGAKALLLDKKIGSLEIGKQADITAVRVNSVDAQPVYDPASSLVYTNSGNRVSHVWVSGKCLLANGQLKTLHEMEIVENARQWGNKIQGQHHT